MSEARGGAAGPVRLRVGAVCVLDEAILLVRYGPGPAGGYWELPAVELVPGETLAEAAVRACLDLAGCDTLCGPFLGFVEQPDADEPEVGMYFEVVLVDHLHAAAAAPEGAAAAEARFVDPDEVPALRLRDGTLELLADQGLVDTVT